MRIIFFNKLLTLSDQLIIRGIYTDVCKCSRTKKAKLNICLSFCIPSHDIVVELIVGTMSYNDILFEASEFDGKIKEELANQIFLKDSHNILATLDTFLEKVFGIKSGGLFVVADGAASNVRALGNNFYLNDNIRLYLNI